jgi:hypothetical protein
MVADELARDYGKDADTAGELVMQFLRRRAGTPNTVLLATRPDTRG